MIRHLLLATTLLLTRVAFAGPCDDAVHRVFNPNAAVAAHKYAQQNHRSVPTYGFILGREFMEFYNSLPVGARILEPGSGIATFSIEAARTRGFHAVAVNAQDFWLQIHKAMSAKELKLALDSNANLMIGGIVQDEWMAIATAMGVDKRPLVRAIGLATPDGLANAAPHAIEFLKELRRAEMRLILSGRFRYLPGYVEEVLPNLKGRFRLAPEAYGAYYYSPDRARVIEAIYNSLEPGGKAFIPVGADSAITDLFFPKDFIAGSKKTLVEALVERYPANFRHVKAGENLTWFTYDRSRGKFDILGDNGSVAGAAITGNRYDVLVITRTADRPELSLPWKLRDPAVSKPNILRGENGFEVPTGNILDWVE